MRPDRILAALPDQIADDLPLLERHCAAGAVGAPFALHLLAKVHDRGEKGLDAAMAGVPFAEQPRRAVEVLVGERDDLEARHAGADDSVRSMAPKTLTGAELELDDGPARDAELFLVDGNNLAYRAFFALPEELQTTDGQPTNALLGFTNMLFKLLSDYRPRGVAVAWDTRPVHRAAVAEAAEVVYKEGRREMPALLREQFPHFRPIVEAFGYRNLEFEGWEADDVIATLATRADEAGIKTCVVSTDRDAFQLCSENVTLMMTPRGVADVNVYTPERVEARYGVRPDQVPDFIGLKGDTSDNIPGVPGIGDKTAGQLIAQYGSLEAVLEHVDELSPARAKNIREHADQARASKELATMRRDLELGVDPAELVSGAPDRSTLKEIFRRFEFRALLGRVDTLDAAVPAAAPVELEGVNVPVARGRAARARRGSSATPPTPTAPPSPPAPRWSSLPKPSNRLLQGPGVSLAVHDCEAAAGRGRRRHAARRLPDRAGTGDLRPRRAGRRIRARARPRAGGRGGDVSPRPSRRGRETTRPAAARAGPRARLRAALRRDRAPAHLRPRARWRTQGSRSTRTGWARSPRASPTGSRSSRPGRRSWPASRSCSARRQQVARILFEVLGLTTGRKGKTGYSTDTRVLRTIRHEHPIVEVLEEWREYSKLLNTYLGPLPTLISRGGRTAAHDVQPGRRRDRPALHVEPEPAGDPGAVGPRPADPLGLRRRGGDAAPLRRLQPGRAAHPGAHLGRAGAQGVVRGGRTSIAGRPRRCSARTPPR